jgi:[NiFe] hydrogenase assembly HybE family chaperone
MTEAPALLPDPSPRLVDAFRAVAACMRGLSFVNPAIEVEAVGFAPWEAHWLGVMVTPWCMNLTLLPRDPAAWVPLPRGAKRRYAFPAGTYEFVGASDAAIGDFQVCSLFSPLLEFDDHASARLVATLARAGLLDPANAEVPEMPVADRSPGAAEASRPAPLAELRQQLQAPLSKRDFLRGRVLRADPPTAPDTRSAAAAGSGTRPSGPGSRSPRGHLIGGKRDDRG